MDGNKFEAKWKTQVPPSIRRSSDGQTAAVQLLLVLNWKKSSSPAIVKFCAENLAADGFGSKYRSVRVATSSV